VLQAKKATLAVAAVAYAQLGIAVGDAFISCWRTKYQYNLLRPITYIRNVIDPNLTTPDLVTPPKPVAPEDLVRAIDQAITPLGSFEQVERLVDHGRQVLDPTQLDSGRACTVAGLGTLAAHGVILTLPDDQPEAKSALSLKFKYYQRVEGRFRVPAGMRVTAVTARAFESGQQSARATRTLQL
jgi:hypothetical protein